MPRVVFRDKLGRFTSGTKRYTPQIGTIQVVRNRRWITISKRSLPATDLANLLSHREFETLPEALRRKALLTSKAKYKAWDIAEKIDKLKGIRRKDMKYTITIQDGKRLKKISFYHRIKRNTKSSYALFQRINQEIGLEGFYLYKTAGGKHLADRKGRQVHLVNIEVEEVL